MLTVYTSFNKTENQSKIKTAMSLVEWNLVGQNFHLTGVQWKVFDLNDQIYILRDNFQICKPPWGNVSRRKNKTLDISITDRNILDISC